MSSDEGDINLLGEEKTEESAQDWGSLNQSAGLLLHDSGMNNDESLPKRSEKFFDSDGSNIQQSKLEDARDQMYLALSHIRGHHAKQLLVGVWIQSKRKAFIPHAKGSYFKDIGRAHTYSVKKKLQGVWLNEIEAVYLVERGSLVIYLADDLFMNFMENENSSFYYGSLVHLSLSHLYAIVFSSDPVLLDKYKVYSLLKRLGYLVMEFPESSQPFDALVPSRTKQDQPQSFISLAYSYMVYFGSVSRRLLAPFFRNRCHFFTFTSIFQSLSMASIGSPLNVFCPPHSVNPRYRIFFNVWKPSPHFSKKNPPQPDFQLGVLSTSRVVFPSLLSIQGSWNQTKFESGITRSMVGKQGVSVAKASKGSPVDKRSLKLKRRADREARLDPKILARNNYLKAKDKLLKQGSTGRSTVFAIVDNGVVNFTTFSETDFRLRSCTEYLSGFESRDNHGIVWNERIQL